jgi:sister-chromatid-cohesion protein PDS5
MELLFARLLSLLAHHPDYPSESSDESTRTDDLADFARYILFYLSAVANQNNLSLIFHIAQRVKQTRDAVSASENLSTNLYTLSDLAQATIRRFAELYSQQHKIGGSGGSGAANILQTYPGKMRLPSALFANMASHREVREVIEKNYLPEEVDDRLDRIVRSFMKPKGYASHGQNVARKRKVETSADVGAHAGDGSAKKAKKSQHKSLSIRKSSSTGTSVKATKRKKNEDDWQPQDGRDVVKPSASRRRSDRGSGKMGISYAEGDSEEDDKQMEQWDQRDESKEDAEVEESEQSDAEEQQAEKQSPETEDNQAASDRDSAMEDVEETSPPPPPPLRAKPAPSKKKGSPVLETKKKRGRKPKPKPAESPTAPANEVSTRRSTRSAR